MTLQADLEVHIILLEKRESTLQIMETLVLASMIRMKV